MKKNKVMVITGTRKGIGKYLAEYYIKKGYQGDLLKKSLVFLFWSLMKEIEAFSCVYCGISFSN